MRDRLSVLKRQIIEMSCRAQEGHIASAFSILDIVWVIYDSVLYDAEGNKNGDFILSKGHASLALYAVLKEKGMIAQSDLDGFASYDSILGGHPDRTKVNGVIASTGSLGHGFPIAVGLAMGKRIQQTPGATYVLIGDGELNEGSMWEAVELAGHHKLSSLCCIVDYNHSTDRALDLGDIAAKFRPFGWDTLEVDGHDHEALRRALAACGTGDRPLAIIARTTKGKGVREMENNPAWHHRFPTEEEKAAMLRELGGEV